MELSKMAEPSVVLLDQLLVCSGPENLAGVPFQLAELDQCLKPTVMTSATKVTSDLGSNVLLRCDATGYPTPTSPGPRSTARPSTAQPIRRGQPVVNRLRPGDRRRHSNGNGDRAAPSTATPAAATPTPTPHPHPATGPHQAGPAGGADGPATTEPHGPEGPVAADSGRNATAEGPAKAAIRGIRATEATAESVALLWAADKAWGDAQLTVVYSPYQEKDKQTATVPAASGRLVLTGLKSGRKYMACLIARGGQSRKDQCVTFSTLEGEQRPNVALLVISGLACTLVLPLIGFLLYKIICLCCQKGGSPANHDQDTYVKFETLSLKQRTMGNAGNDLWTRRQTQESERMLLFSRSSIDSQMTYKSDSSRSEYLC
ncbi:hypothetical protein ANANG_G00096170 [Anguilla anguilla]|uniref:Fibronectin type-III domain-containing protein n=1 Tax=Anguilla anguilla TaxID=7936 RepID=A0A9D3MII6_ANGAN|nr:hypothetical protein ANANG_G00096170 [Anguilla anguilla]